MVDKRCEECKVDTRSDIYNTETVADTVVEQATAY